MALHNEVVASLDSLTAEMNLLNHPFYQEWTAGKLPLQRLHNYAVQYYHHVVAFPRYLSAIHTGCEDLLTRQALLENLIDEERGAENHPELWLRFAETLGLARETVLASEPLPATQALVHTFVELTKYLSLVAGLAALYVYESQTPAVAEAKIAVALKQLHCMTTGRNADLRSALYGRGRIEDTQSAEPESHGIGPKSRPRSSGQWEKRRTDIWRLCDFQFTQT